MALAAAIEWDIRTTGADTNGGGFKAGASGTDHSQQDGAFATLTTLSVVAATTTDITVSLTDYTVAAGDVGNVYQNTGGSSTAGFYEITAVNTGTNTWTMDRSVGTAAQTCAGVMGGALATVGKVSGAVAVAGNTIWLKAGTYTLGATWTCGPTSKGDVTNGKIKLYGYSSTHGDYAGRPLITSSTNSVALLTFNDADYWQVRHVKFTHTAATRGIGISCVTTLPSPLYFIDCIFDGTSRALSNTLASCNLNMIGCEVANCNDSTAAVLCSFSGATGGSAASLIYGCYFHDNTGDACRNSNGLATVVQISWSIFDTNGGAGFNDVSTSSNVGIVVDHCVFYANTTDGITAAAKASNVTVVSASNCIFYGQGQEGIDQNDTQAQVDADSVPMFNCAFGSNSGGNYSGISAGIGEIALSADPFVNAAGGNFALNTTSGGGAALRAAAYPGTFPGGLTISYADVGAAQHADPTATGGLFIRTSGP